MKILHTESSQGWGGQELRTVLEARLLIERGHEVYVAIAERSQFKARAPSVKQHLVQARIAKKSFRGLFEAIRIVLKVQPSLIITHSSTDSWLFSLAKVLAFREAAVIRVRHVSAPVKSNWTSRWLYRTPVFVITTSEDIRSHLINSLGIDPDKCYSVPTGIDANRFSSDVLERKKCVVRDQLGLGASSKLLVMVSTLRSWKGHEFAIRSMVSLSNYILVIVGDGPRELYLKNLVSELSLENRVLFVGHTNSVEDYLASADIFLQPSTKNEGVSQSLLQAGALGLPVIAGNIGGLNEVVVHEESGLLVEPESTTAIVSAVKKFESMPPLAQSCAKRLREEVIKYHSHRLMIEKLETLYLRAVKRP